MMKKRAAHAVYWLLFLLAFGPFAHAKQPFEGRLDMRISAPRFSGTAAFFLSKHGTRIDAENEKMHQVLLMQPQKEVLYRLNVTTKTYTQLDLEATRRRRAALSRLKKYTIEKHGEETLLGYTCWHFTISDGRLTLELWTAKNLLDGKSLKRLSAASQFLGVNEKMLEKMEKEGVAGFPMKMQAEMQGRKVKTELINIKRQDIVASLFKVPENYSMQPGAYPAANGRASSPVSKP